CGQPVRGRCRARALDAGARRHSRKHDVGVTAPGIRSIPADACEIRSDVSAALWDEYVVARPDTSMYHLSPWAGVMRDAFGHRTQSLAALTGERVTGILPLVYFN